MSYKKYHVNNPFIKVNQWSNRKTLFDSMPIRKTLAHIFIANSE